jgi:hypothetical protein
MSPEITNPKSQITKNKVPSGHIFNAYGEKTKHRRRREQNARRAQLYLVFFRLATFPFPLLRKKINSTLKKLFSHLDNFISRAYP